MVERWYKKGLVIGIVILFIGVSISTSTGKIDTDTSKTIVYNGSLLGYVKDISGNPIEGALVRVYFHENYEEDYSDSNGYYHVTNIPICYCLKNITCSKEGYKTEQVLLGIAENTVHDFILIADEEMLEYNSELEYNNEIEPDKNIVDLPDLIIEDIIQIPDDIIYLQWLYCRVRNIGNEVLSGNVNIYFGLYLTLFTIIPVKYTKSYSGTVHSLKPGEAEDILIDRNDNIPRFGFYRFTCEVNPNKAVPEDNYDNNYREFDYFIFPSFFGPWIKWFN